MDNTTYHYDVPKNLVWVAHIVIGLVIAYIGYLIINDRPIDKNYATALQVIGVIAALYHAHLWYSHRNKK